MLNRRLVGTAIALLGVGLLQAAVIVAYPERPASSLEWPLKLFPSRRFGSALNRRGHVI